MEKGHLHLQGGQRLAIHDGKIDHWRMVRIAPANFYYYFLPKSISPMTFGSLSCSMTKFGGILPKWQHFKSLWHLFPSLLNIWQNVFPCFEIFNGIGHIFIVSNEQILKNNIASGHTADMLQWGSVTIGKTQRIITYFIPLFSWPPVWLVWIQLNE